MRERKTFRRTRWSGQRLRAVPFLLLAGLFFTLGCNKDEGIDTGISADIRSVNNYINESMDIYYLWREFIPPNLNPNAEPDPEVFFDKFLYKAEDRWSFITDDYEALINSFSGINYTFGHNFKLFQKEGTQVVYGVVEYVVRDSPADAAGIRRGDVFNRVDGVALSPDNYLSLLFGKESYTLGFAEIAGDEVVSTDREVDLVAATFQEHPVFLDTVYELAARKVGYFVYTQFISDFDQDLHDLFSEFKSRGITDLVIDLRYNPGGKISTARLLANLIAPADQVNSGAVFSKYEWNDILEQYWIDQQGVDSPNLVVKFTPTAGNLDLGRVYFLVTRNSASASETLINGLIPYMEVVLIGETTSGKYTGSLTLHDPDRSFNWAMQPIVLKTVNADGNTEFRDGFAPDYLVKDDLFAPLGSVEEDMLAQALSLITGIPPDQLARKASPAILARSRVLISGGRVPIEERQWMYIDDIRVE